MKMKISDILRKSNDETMAKIIGAVIAMHIDGISEEEAVELEYPHTLETLQSEMDVDYTPTNADRIRAMSDEELAEFLDDLTDNCCRYAEHQNCGSCYIGLDKKSGFCDIEKWLQSEVEG